MKQLTAINLICINGIYHPTQPISEDMAKMLGVSAEPASEADIKKCAKKAHDRLEKALSAQYSSNIEEYERV